MMKILNPKMIPDMKSKDLRIVFMGTPEFAVESLKALLVSGKNIVGVITAPDKPSGRGKQLQSSPVKDFALKQNLNLFQPVNLKDPEFVSSLAALKPDLNIVVAFRMLPEIVWSLPVMGTFNLHASLLPDYRGAAPINRVIMNGEKETGVTTFLINHEIDTGNILLQEKTTIGTNETAGELHDRLMTIGARLVNETVDAFASNSIKPVPQNAFTINQPLKTAPKIFKDDCRIKWDSPVEKVYNFIRGLSPYPAAYTEFMSSNERHLIKIYFADKVFMNHSVAPGTIETDSKKILRISAAGGYLDIRSLQMAGKRRLNTEEFLRGFAGLEKFKAF